MPEASMRVVRIESNTTTEENITGISSMGGAQTMTVQNASDKSVQNALSKTSKRTITSSTHNENSSF